MPLDTLVDGEKLNDLFTRIGNAIRIKKDKNTPINVYDMENEILSISESNIKILCNQIFPADNPTKYIASTPAPQIVLNIEPDWNTNEIVFTITTTGDIELPLFNHITAIYYAYASSKMRYDIREVKLYSQSNTVYASGNPTFNVVESTATKLKISITNLSTAQTTVASPLSFNIHYQFNTNTIIIIGK